MKKETITPRRDKAKRFLRALPIFRICYPENTKGFPDKSIKIEINNELYIVFKELLNTLRYFTAPRHRVLPGLRAASTMFFCNISNHASTYKGS
jgi:hypothetical protein